MLVRESLRILHTGLGREMVIPDVLAQWFQARGIDLAFAERGGLRRVTEQIEALDKQRAEAIRELEHYLTVYGASPSPVSSS